MNNDLTKGMVIVLVTAFLWVLFYQINILLFHKAELSPIVSWVFLPAGIKIISVIVFDELGVLGLFFGAIATYYISNLNAGNPLILATVSASSPFFAVHASRYILKLDSLYSNLKGIHLFLIAFVYAVTNTLFHQLYLGVHMRNLVGFANNQFAMFCGDLSGSLLLLVMMSYGIKYLKCSHVKSKQKSI
jgi:hypothetical protein